MFAVLDPLIFDPTFDRGGLPQRVRRVNRLLRSIPELVIPDIAGYWTRLESDCLRPLHSQIPGPDRRGLDELQYRVQKVEPRVLPPALEQQGFGKMFAVLPAPWPTLMRTVVSSCLLTPGEATVLISMLVRSRNVEIDQVEHCKLLRKTIWQLRIRELGTEGWQAAPVICSSRNLAVEWTTRFDDYLPAAVDGAEFPFCPPIGWSSPETAACRTFKSRPTWCDARDSHWAWPNTPGLPEHWDVYLPDPVAEEYGLDQLNIGKWGTQRAGSIHHVPTTKESRLRKTTGWQC